MTPARLSKRLRALHAELEHPDWQFLSEAADALDEAKKALEPMAKYAELVPWPDTGVLLQTTSAKGRASIFYEDIHAAARAYSRMEGK